jgi:hypothetical protein
MSIVEQWPELISAMHVATPINFALAFYVSNVYELKDWQTKYKIGSASTYGELMYMFKEFDKYPPSNLECNVNFYATKNNILPFWESEENKHGGRWSFIIYRSRPAFIDNCLSYVDTLLLSLICAMSTSEDELVTNSFTNIIFTVKPKHFKVSIWINDIKNKEAAFAVGDEIVKVLQNSPKFENITTPLNLDLQLHNDDSIIKHIDITYQ